MAARFPHGFDDAKRDGVSTRLGRCLGRGREQAGIVPLTLLVDADDTLWENNIYFLEVAERFVEALGAMGVDPGLARERLSETERKNIPVHGYGSRAFSRSVVEAFEALAPEQAAETVEYLRLLAYKIYERDSVELRPGVREALNSLCRHHDLILLTKGDPEEQEWKLECSGLRHHFTWVEIVQEKTAATYREIIDRLALDPSRTWMVGNSPRSDINPALAAGISAVLIPHPHTWELELEDVRWIDGRLHIVDSISDVVALFVPESR